MSSLSSTPANGLRDDARLGICAKRPESVLGLTSRCAGSMPIGASQGCGRAAGGQRSGGRPGRGGWSRSNRSTSRTAMILASLSSRRPGANPFSSRQIVDWSTPVSSSSRRWLSPWPNRASIAERPIATRTCCVRSPCFRWVYGTDESHHAALIGDSTGSARPVMPCGASKRDDLRPLGSTNPAVADVMPRRASPRRVVRGGPERQAELRPFREAPKPRRAVPGGPNGKPRSSRGYNPHNPWRLR